MSTRGLLLQAGQGGAVIPIHVDGLESLQKAVGGNIDAVRLAVNDRIYVVGYCHDEGMLLDMDINWLASALFHQKLHGNVVLVNGYDETGIDDGESHDLPTEFMLWVATTFARKVGETYNESVMISMIIQYAIENDIVSTEETQVFQDAIRIAVEEPGEHPAEDKIGLDFINRVMDLIMEKKSAGTADQLETEIYEFLDSQTGDSK